METFPETGHIPCEDDLNRDRLAHCLVAFVGQSVRVTTRNGSCFEGLFHSCSIDQDSTVVLKYAHELPSDVHNRLSGEVLSTLIIPGEDLLYLEADVVDNEFPAIHRPKKEGFLTDDAITGASGDGEARSLVVWEGPEDPSSLALSLDESGAHRGKDQFRVNEELFGVVSTYDADLYTTLLDPSTIPEQKRIEAERIAREIEEGQLADSASRRAMDREADEDQDEEDLHASVSRARGSPPAESQAIESSEGRETEEAPGRSVPSQGVGALSQLPQDPNDPLRGGIRANDSRAGRRLNALNLELPQMQIPHNLTPLWPMDEPQSGTAIPDAATEEDLRSASPEPILEDDADFAKAQAQVASLASELARDTGSAVVPQRGPEASASQPADQQSVSSQAAEAPSSSVADAPKDGQKKDMQSWQMWEFPPIPVTKGINALNLEPTPPKAQARPRDNAGWRVEPRKPQASASAESQSWQNWGCPPIPVTKGINALNLEPTPSKARPRETPSWPIERWQSGPAEGAAASRENLQGAPPPFQECGPRVPIGANEAARIGVPEAGGEVVEAPQPLPQQKLRRGGKGGDGQKGEASPSSAMPSAGPRGRGRGRGGDLNEDMRRGNPSMQQMDGGNMGGDRRMNGYNDSGGKRGGNMQYNDNSAQQDFQFNPQALNFVPSPKSGAQNSGQAQQGGGDNRQMINIDMSPGGSLTGKMNYEIARQEPHLNFPGVGPGQAQGRGQGQGQPAGQGMHMQGQTQGMVGGMMGGSSGADHAPQQGMGQQGLVPAMDPGAIQPLQGTGQGPGQGMNNAMNQGMGQNMGQNMNMVQGRGQNQNQDLRRSNNAGNLNNSGGPGGQNMAGNQNQQNMGRVDPNIVANALASLATMQNVQQHQMPSPMSQPGPQGPPGQQVQQQPQGPQGQLLAGFQGMQQSPPNNQMQMQQPPAPAPPGSWGRQQIPNILDRFFDKLKFENTEVSRPFWAEATGAPFRQALGDTTVQGRNMPPMMPQGMLPVGPPGSNANANLGPGPGPPPGPPANNPPNAGPNAGGGGGQRGGGQGPGPGPMGGPMGGGAGGCTPTTSGPRGRRGGQGVQQQGGGGGPGGPQQGGKVGGVPPGPTMQMMQMSLMPAPQQQQQQQPQQQQQQQQHQQQPSRRGDFPQQMGTQPGGQMGGPAGPRNNQMGGGGQMGGGNQMGNGGPMGGGGQMGGGGPMGGGGGQMGGCSPMGNAGQMGGGTPQMGGGGQMGNQMVPMSFQQPPMYQNAGPQGPDGNQRQQRSQNHGGGMGFNNQSQQRGGGNQGGPGRGGGGQRGGGRQMQGGPMQGGQMQGGQMQGGQMQGAGGTLPMAFVPQGMSPQGMSPQGYHPQQGFAMTGMDQSGDLDQY